MGKKKNGKVLKDMTLTGHLDELRKRMLICILALVMGMLLCLQASGRVTDWLIEWGVFYGYQFIFVSPQEMIIQYLKVALVGGIFCSFPVLIFEVFRFLYPALKDHEKRNLIATLIFGFFFFLIGLLFAHMVSLPFMLKFLIKVNTSKAVQAMITVENYLSFILTVYIVFGIVFEMPVILGLLTQIGLIKPGWLKRFRPYMFVVIFVIAAFITPPDIFSQIMVAIPMCGLYEISIFISMGIKKRKDKR